jgi:hypothetical protein
MITTKQAETVLPAMGAAVAALHEVWEKCREVERALGRDLDGLEGVIQDMAAGVDDPESIDVDYVHDDRIPPAQARKDPCQPQKAVA